MPGNDHPPETKGPRRRRTVDPSHAGSTQQSIMRRWTHREGSQPSRKNGLVREFFSCYEGLEWATLRDYMEKRWPGWKVDEGSVQKLKDYWTFDAPEKLSKEDRAQIAALRDANKTKSSRRQSFSGSE